MDEKELYSILLDKDLAKFGDSYVNFLYSVTISAVRRIPSGVRVSDKILVEAAKKAGIREKLPKRTPKGRIADAVEALLIFSLIEGEIGFKEMLDLLIKSRDNPVEGFAKIICVALRRLNDL